MDRCLNIIVVEDNDDLREATVDALFQEGYKVQGLDCAESLSELSSWQSIDLMVVDLNLPGEDGLSLARRVRTLQPDIGIIMVTARGLTVDKQRGYASGADIYLAKPVSLEELSAAIQALSRRLKPRAAQLAGFRLDPASHSLNSPNQATLVLSSQESALLVALSRAPEGRLETWQLIEILGKEKAENPKMALEITIARLRAKLQKGGCSGISIKSIRNWGYQLLGPLQLD